VHARSTEITAENSRIDQGISRVRNELMPDLLQINGCRGLSLLVDRATGRCIATSSWEDEQSMRESEDEVRPLRDDFIAAFGGTSPNVEEWDIALMHRVHQSTPGAWARVTWLEGTAAAIDNSVGAFREALATAEKTMPGISGASSLINRDVGLAVGTVVYDSATAAAQARGQANLFRAGVAEQSGTEILEVADFELAVAHLRIPELA
jgi:hypothetical protein